MGPRVRVPLVLLLAAALLVMLSPGPARGATVTGLSLVALDTTNASLAEAIVELQFTGNASDLLAVAFEWTAPNGTLVWTDRVTPNPNGVARSAYLVASTGDWRVNATYPDLPPLLANVTMRVLPATWGPGTVDVSGPTRVGRLGTLVIAPGTTIRFSSGGAGILIAGSLDARGTAAEPLEFTRSGLNTWLGLFVDPGGFARIENATIRSAMYGVYGVRGATWIENSVVEDSFVGLFLSTPGTVARNVRLERNDVGIGATNFGGAIENVTLVDNPLGMNFDSSAGATVMGFSISGSSDAAVLSTGGDLFLGNGGIHNSTVGVRVASGTVRLEDVTVDRGAESLVARGGRLEAWNGTLVNPAVAHANATGGGSIVLVNTTAAQVERIRVDAVSSVVIRNFLRVRAEDYDRGANVSGARVRVYDDDREVAVLATDANGTTPRLVVTDRVISPSPRGNVTRIVVDSPGLLFARNNRTVDMSATRTEVFRGSARDNDGDLEPDFSDADDDNDGLTDTVEGTLGTDPMDADSDGDGMPDGWEFVHQLRALDAADGPEDADGDGLTNQEEFDAGTNPRAGDTDGDRMPDAWEVAHGLDATNASDAESDPDGDGYSNLDEFRGGSDPLDSGSRPSLPFGAAGSWAWYVLALVLAVAIIALSLWVRRRRGGRVDGPTPHDG